MSNRECNCSVPNTDLTGRCFKCGGSITIPAANNPDTQLSEKWVKATATWNSYPNGTKAKANLGGYWVKTDRGWHWPGGGTFPTPGGDATGEVCLPETTLQMPFDVSLSLKRVARWVKEGSLSAEYGTGYKEGIELIWKEYAIKLHQVEQETEVKIEKALHAERNKFQATLTASETEWALKVIDLQTKGDKLAIALRRCKSTMIVHPDYVSGENIEFIDRVEGAEKALAAWEAGNGLIPKEHAIFLNNSGAFRHWAEEIKGLPIIRLGHSTSLFLPEGVTQAMLQEEWDAYEKANNPGKKEVGNG